MDTQPAYIGLLFRFDSDEVRRVYAAARTLRGDNALLLLDPFDGVRLVVPGGGVAPAYAIGWEAASQRADALLADSWGPGSPALLFLASLLTPINDAHCVGVELVLVPHQPPEFSFLMRQDSDDE